MYQCVIINSIILSVGKGVIVMDRYFFKKLVLFIGSVYHLCILLALSIAYIIVFQFISITLLPENVTWIYSSSMQTLAALIALLPISYAYFLDNLDKESYENFDSYVLEKLRKDVYIEMMVVIIFALIIIVLNLFGFFLFQNVLYAFLVALFTIDAIALIALYIYRLFDPNRVKDILKEFDVSKKTDASQKIVLLDEFITEYLELETCVKDFVSNENDNAMVNDLPLYDIVDNLSKDFEELNEHYNDFKEIIFHRNNLIHNYNDTTVDYSKYSKMLDLQRLFNKFNNQFVQRKIFTNVTKINAIIDLALKEYLEDQQNIEDENKVSTDFKEDITTLLHSYFISDYYDTISLDEAEGIDFEVIQNNYSNKRLVGIDIKAISSKNIKAITTAFFKRLEKRFMYLFLINYDLKNNHFVVYYKTKDNAIKSFII